MSVTAVADIAAHDDPAYEWKAVLLLSVAFGLVGLDRWLVAPLAPQIMLDLGLNAGDINNLVAVLGIAWGLAAVLMGGLSDRIGRRRVMLPAMLVFWEIFGGGLALVVAGAVINRFGIAYMVYLALGGLLLGAIVMAFLRETAPRLKALPRGNADGYDSRGSDRA